MTSLDLWEAFVETHRARSVSAAARVLKLSQPAVSARLKRLEGQLGTLLFTRTRVGVVPTVEADVFADRVRPLIDQLRAVVADPGAGVSGRIRIGGAADVTAARIVPALAPLVRDGLDVEVCTGLATDLLASLGRGELDLVVSSVRPTDGGLRARAFVDEEFLLVAAPAWAGCPLADVPLLAYADDLPIIRRYWLTEFERRPTQRVALVLPDLRGLLRAVVAGAGASVLPRYLVDKALIDGTVLRLHEPRLGPLNTLWLVTDAQPSALAATVSAHLEAEAASWAST